MNRIYIYLATMALVLASCSGRHATRDAVLASYLPEKTVGQILYVEQTDSSSAMALYYVREADGWRLDIEADAFIGQNGVGKEKEGDRRTPLGDYGIGTAFGILPNPGTSLSYIEVTDSWYACEEEEYYNQLIDTALVHHDCHGEHLIACDPDYHYAITTNYNPDCTVGLGSNIFIHCKGNKPYTAGCVALDEEVMRHILLTCDSNMVVSIHVAE